MLLALCLFAFGLAQLDAPYPSWMRESDNELRREEEEVGMMPASPLKETRLWGLEQRKREAAAAADTYNRQRAAQEQREASRPISTTNYGEQVRAEEEQRRKDFLEQQIASVAQRKQDAATAKRAQESTSNWQGTYPQEQREFDDALRRDRSAVEAMPDSPLKETRRFGIEQREQEQSSRERINNDRVKEELARAQAACGSGRQLQAVGASCNLRRVMELQRKLARSKQRGGGVQSAIPSRRKRSPSRVLAGKAPRARGSKVPARGRQAGGRRARAQPRVGARQRQARGERVESPILFFKKRKGAGRQRRGARRGSPTRRRNVVPRY